MKLFSTHPVRGREVNKVGSSNGTHQVHSVLAIAILAVFGIAYFLNPSFFTAHKVGASSTDNVSGWAWSENIGWISFNNTSDGSAQAYGVNINAVSGDFSGNAWSENIGWISFNRSETNNPPSAPFVSGTAIANYNKNTGKVTGWARALAGCEVTSGVPVTSCVSSGAGAATGGWDGWIRLSDDLNSNWVDKGVTISNNLFSGYAWGDSVVGWIDVAPTIGGVFVGVKIDAPANVPPTAVIYSPAVAPVNATPSKSIVFTGYGTDLGVGDTIVEYYWAYGSTVLSQGYASNTTVFGIPAHTFTATIPLGTYTANTATGIRFVVKDSKGTWSQAVYVPTFTVSNPLITVSLTANGSPGSISVAPGSTVTLAWTVVGSVPTSCNASIDNADPVSTWPGAKDIGGGTQGVTQPNFNQTYRISCTNGTLTDAAFVTVNYTFKKNDGRCEANKGETVINSPLDCKVGKIREVQ